MTDQGPFWSVAATRHARQEFFDLGSEQQARTLYAMLIEVGVTARLVSNETMFSQDKVVEPSES